MPGYPVIVHGADPTFLKSTGTSMLPAPACPCPSEIVRSAVVQIEGGVVGPGVVDAVDTGTVVEG